MPTVTFSNPGLLDIRCVTTMGVSVKEGDSPIGFFGTGLKYAIATLLRTGHQVEIWIGQDCYTFESIDSDIRGKTFSIVQMRHGSSLQPLGFTTELGKNWTPMQAYRELHSNCLDEGGQIHDQHEGPSDRNTVIRVHGSACHEAYLQRSKIFLSSKPAAISDDAEIHMGSSRSVYYRGVQIFEAQKPFRFTYNIKRDITLTEDRTAKYSWQLFNAIQAAILICDNESILCELLPFRGTAPCVEDEFSYDTSWPDPSPAFLRVVEALNPRVNLGARKRWRDAKGIAPMEDIAKFELDKMQQLMFNKAVSFCKEVLDMDVAKYHINFATDLGENTAGQAHIQSKSIWLSKLAFANGTKYLAATLVEEFLHLDRNVQDCTREFQEILLNLAVSMGEQIKGEPL